MPVRWSGVPQPRASSSGGYVGPRRARMFANQPWAPICWSSMTAAWRWG